LVMNRNRKPTRGFFERGTLSVARSLIGMHLVHDDGRTVRAGRIVETEAYLGPRDRAAHSSRGRTRRTEVMFGPAGHAYVYFIYGFWNCLNVVTGRAGVPHAVLLRALEPLGDLTDSTWGPGLLCRALHIDRRLNGAAEACGRGADRAFRTHRRRLCRRVGAASLAILRPRLAVRLDGFFRAAAHPW
jgi:DNA-3-methyladenine glycosylase